MKHTTTATNRRAGITLAELLIAMAVFTIVLALSMRLYVTTYQSIDRQQGRMGTMASRQAALQTLRQDVRLAQSVQLTTLDGGGQRLVLALPGGGESGRQIEYRAENGGLQRLEAPGETDAASEPTQLIEQDPVEFGAGSSDEGLLVRVAFGPVVAQRVPAMELVLHPRNAL